MPGLYVFSVLQDVCEYAGNMWKQFAGRLEFKEIRAICGAFSFCKPL